VSAGQLIAKVGSTGDSTGAHLHLEVRVDGLHLDPKPWLKARGIEW
jgi:murein DD-endopeptidase MepM/ murein hydrolase activator NlpD